jgi:predicted TPR repeat methyltransferase
VKSEPRFDAAYFDRFYESRASRVYGKAQVAHLARAVSELIAWFGGDVRSVLDVGAGTGLWRDWFRRHRPRVRYVSTDVSAYACERYGHEQRDVARWRSKERFDLVVCQGVLPYLSDADCRRALANIAAMARGFIYVEAITQRDLTELCDREKTDVTVRARPAAFYRRALAKHFDPLGCGLHYVKNGPLGFYELERL